MKFIPLNGRKFLPLSEVKSIDSTSEPISPAQRLGQQSSIQTLKVLMSGDSPDSPDKYSFKSLMSGDVRCEAWESSQVYSGQKHKIPPILFF